MLVYLHVRMQYLCWNHWSSWTPPRNLLHSDFSLHCAQEVLLTGRMKAWTVVSLMFWTFQVCTAMLNTSTRLRNSPLHMHSLGSCAEVFRWTGRMTWSLEDLRNLQTSVVKKIKNWSGVIFHNRISVGNRDLDCILKGGTNGSGEFHSIPKN